MNSTSPITNKMIVAIILACASVHLLTLVLSQSLLKDWRWEQIPFHSAIEISGSVIAFFVAYMLVILEKNKNGTSYNFIIAGALIAMGVLDGMHSIVPKGHLFVWLHSSATFFGGVFFLCICLPVRWRRQLNTSWLWFVSVFSILFALLSILFADNLPLMAGPFGFTATAIFLNVVGGGLLLIAAIKLFYTYRTSKKADDLLFMLPCILFGFAAIMFQQSVLWDFSWWGWHILRFVAYGVALWFALSNDLLANLQIKQSRDALNEQVEIKSAQLDQASHLLKMNQAQQNAIFRCLTDAIIVCDKAANIIFFSQPAQKMFGYSESEAEKLNINQILKFPSSELDKSLNSTSIIHSAFLSKNKELIAIDNTQNELPVEIVISEVELNHQVNMVAVIRDISSRKQYELQLKHSKELAEEATKTKSDFLANMSHEIRTPMNAIIGMSYLALQTDLSRKQADYINKVHRSAEALLGIINDILDFSKMEAGKLQLEAAPFCLNETLDHLVQTISHKSQQKGLELLIDLAPNLPLNLVGDSLRLGQILINLTNNSIKFTEEGEIIVKVREQRRDETSITIEFSVNDSGIGMTEEQLSRLFSAFSQADASTTRKYGGTGLGLTISKTLTELMQGKIWVESTYGEGSQFFFTATFGLTDEPQTTDNTPAISLVDLPMLIVDDSLASRTILFNLAKGLGFKPELAASGQEALEKLALAETHKQGFKLVLSDWKMPYMDGIQLGELIAKEGFLLAAPKLILITAYDRDIMLQKAQHINLAGSITKPVTAKMLLNATMKAMSENLADPESNQPSKFDAAITKEIQGAEILLVEDNDINQQIAVELLEMAGLNVTVADNGQIAIDEIARHAFDAVLMDVQMPVMDGYTATQEIRKNYKLASLPIIAMTANAMTGDKEKCLAAGMNEHVAKPIDPQELYHTLTKWIKPTGKSVKDSVSQKQISESTGLPNLPEFDVDSAVARMGGNIKLYRSILKKTAHSEADAMQRIRQALEQNDYKTAALLAHTLKGVASSIGANFVLPIAQQLELLLSEKAEQDQPLNVDELEKLLIACEAKLNLMIDSIETEQQSVTSPKMIFNTELVSQLLAKLRAQTDKINDKENKDFQDIKSYLKTAPLPQISSKLLIELERYDFAGAEAILKEFTQEISTFNTAQSNLSNSKGDAKGNSQTITDEALLDKLKILAEQIKESDSGAAATVDELLDLALSQALANDIEKLRCILSEYDFDAADAQISAILTTHFSSK